MPLFSRFARGFIWVFAPRELHSYATREANHPFCVSSISRPNFPAIVQLFSQGNGNLEMNMKREFKIMMMTMLLVTASTAPVLAADNYAKEGVTGAAGITVTLTGIKDIKGAVTAGLYNSEDAYKNGGTVRGVRVDVAADTVIISYSDLPDGEYAIKLFHDVNGNGDLDANLFGIPTEPFAFSNNAVGKMGPAKWKDAKFTIINGDNTHAITLN